MNLNLQSKLLLLVMPFFLFLIGCSGDDGIEGGGEKPEVNITGTAATGAPLADVQLEAKSADGTIDVVTTSPDGKFSLKIIDKTGPYLLRATRNSNKPLFSIASASGVTNVHPLTDLIIRNWFQVQGYDLEYEFERNGGAQVLPTVENINDIKTAISSILQTGFGEFSIANDFDLLSTAFDANNQGFDQYLDHLRIELEYNNIELTLKQLNTNTETTVISDVALSNDFTAADVDKPSDPSGVQILQGSLGLVVVWNESTDNYGVSGYNIYRNGAQIASTSFPFYSDTELPTPVPAAGYCYQVEAFDGAGNKSNLFPIPQTCSTAGVLADGIAPPKPSAPTLISQGSHAVTISWPPAVDDTGNGVLGYDIYKGTTNAVDTAVSTIVGTTFRDASPSNDGTDCYTIRAFDASRNTSVPSNEICVTVVQLDTTVPITTASPGGGSYSGSVSVRLSCDDGLLDSGCADTFYTLDGSVPTQNSTRYSGPITLSQTTTLRFFSTDMATNAENSTANSETYTIESLSTGGTGIGFTASNYNVSEADGTVTITVSRGGDISEAASVDYTVVAGTASDIEDFVPTQGSLSWAANDGANKTFFVTLKGDNRVDDNETVLLSLSNVSANAQLATSSATLTIADRPCTNYADLGHPNIIIQDVTLDQACVVIFNSITVGNSQSNPQLTIAPGTTLIFQNSTGIRVSSTGSLVANGQENARIVFTSLTKTPGVWRGVAFINSNNNNNIINHALIEYAGLDSNGTGNIIVYGNNPGSTVNITNSVLQKSSGFGLDASLNTTAFSFNNNIVINNDIAPVELSVQFLHVLNPSNRFQNNGPDNIASIKVTDSRLNQISAVSWKAIDVAYEFQNNITVDSPLIIDAGAELRFYANDGLRINSTGSLNAVGTVDNKILFTGVTTNNWRGIEFINSDSPDNQLEYVIVERGGDGAGNGNANVTSYGNTGGQVSISNSELRNSPNYGFKFDTASSIPQFKNNTVVNNNYPGILPITKVHYLDSSSDYTGNSNDVVQVLPVILTEIMTWPYIGVDYWMDGGITVQAPLTFEPGVTVAMNATALFRVQSTANITALGTSQLPITFTSYDYLTTGNTSVIPWQGITFINSANNIMDNVVVRFGGGIGGNGIPANLRLYGNFPGSKLELSNSTIGNSDNWGVWVSPESTFTELALEPNSYVDNIKGTVCIEVTGTNNCL